MKINLHIERLVLEGVSVDPSQRSVFKATIISELSRLLAVERASSAMPLSASSSRSVRGGVISVEGNRNPLDLGQQIASAVYRGVGR